VFGLFGREIVSLGLLDRRKRGEFDPMHTNPPQITASAKTLGLFLGTGTERNARTETEYISATFGSRIYILWVS
jgi:hypothetical protein